MMDIPENSKVYCFDIDGTICNEMKGDCENAEPIYSRINIINQLFNNGATIYLMTARGMIDSQNNQFLADIRMRLLTENQLKKWGVQYHQLFFGKPRAMHYVDDKGWNDSDFFRQF
jgi:ribonucleotide monophosphatase NagD (HAD superfamily)